MNSVDDRDDGVEPGFLDAPELMVRVEEALRLVNRDVATIGPGRECRFRFFDEERGRNGNAYVETWDGHTGSSCAREHDGAAVWWCGGGGHAVALIGEWPHR